MKQLTTRIATAAGMIVLVAIVMWTPGAAQSPSGSSEGTFSGATLFDDYCKACHGTGAKGDGPLAKLLRRSPANLTLLAQRNGGTYSAEMVARIIDGRKPLAGHGGGDMPVWGEAFDNTTDGAKLTQQKITALVRYLESLQQK